MAKKSLGQNFLNSKSIVNDIIKTTDFSNLIVLEVGPGYGILTCELLKSAKCVIAFEKDDLLFAQLKNKFNKELTSGKLVLINDDIFNLKKYKKPMLLINSNKFKVISNIPYYITGKLFRFLFNLKNTPSDIVFMIQKEVAERIVSYDKKESILSLSIKAYGTPKYIKNVGANNFTPKPKVDSAIILIKNISKDFFIGKNEDKFFEIIKLGFSHKRKLLRNNININTEPLTKCGLGNDVRAEELTISDWDCLYKTLYS